MIQDIAPHRLDRTYVMRDATADDIALCYYKGSVLLKIVGEQYELPTFGELNLSGRDAVHVFRLDDKDCFLTPPPEEADEGFEYIRYDGLRQVKPNEIAYAAVSGATLNRWYKTRKYCGRCGAKMKPSTTERAVVCPECGLTEYPKISPVIIVAVTDGDKILVTKYANRPTMSYALIAGFVEFGETLEETVHREVMEEAGVKIKNLQYYKSQPWSFTDTIISGFFCEVDGSTEIHMQEEELCLAKWVKREDLPNRAGEISLTAEMIELFRTQPEHPILRFEPPVFC